MVRKNKVEMGETPEVVSEMTNGKMAALDEMDRTLDSVVLAMDGLSKYMSPTETRDFCTPLTNRIIKAKDFTANERSKVEFAENDRKLQELRKTPEGRAKLAEALKSL